ncbi:MAG: MFS transporter [Caulobacteraceae bacterium]|nr:MFS transporter [Caulobacteraceae bacterium]
MTQIAGPTEERDGGWVAGLVLACIPATIVVATCVALPILPKVAMAFTRQPGIVAMTPLVAVLPTLTVGLAGAGAGVLGDKVGRRRLLIWSTLVFAVCGVAPIWLSSFAIILVSRAVAGLAIGAMITSAVALTGDYFSGAPLQRWLAAQGGISAISGVIVSAASGALGEASWRLAFLPMFIGWPLFAALFFMPSPKPVALAAGASAGEAAGSAPWATWIGIFLLMSVGAALIFPPAYELGALLQEKALGSSWLTGLGVAILAAGAAVSAFSVPALRRISPPLKVAIAVGASGVGTIMVAQATTLVPLMVGAALDGVGQGVLGPVLSIWLLEATPERLRGRAVGMFQTTTFLTLFVAPLAARWLAIGLGSSSSGMRFFAIGDLALVLAITPVFFRRRVGGLASSG